MTTVNFTGVKDGAEVLPNGKYLCQCDEVERKEGVKGDYLAFKFQVAEGEYEGRTLYLNASLSPQSLWRLKVFLKAFGWDDAKLSGEVSFDENTDFSGLFVTAQVSTKLYNGKTVNNVDEIFLPNEKMAQAVVAKSAQSAQTPGGTEKPAKPPIRLS